MGQRIERIRTDNSREYVNNQPYDFCEHHGIKGEMTNKNTPQQNSVAERKLRTLVEMGSCKLQSKDLPLRLWGKAVSTATCVLNRSLTTCLKNITLKEARSHKKPSAKYFRIFGCEAFVHIPDLVKEKKFDKQKCQVHLC